MIREAENQVIIEGYLSESDLKYGSFVKKDGTTAETITGQIKVLVDQVINEEPTPVEIPVSIFVTKMKNNGEINPAFTGIENVMNSYISIAAAGGKEKADKVRITSGKLQKNEYYNANGKLISFPRITTSFVNKVTGNFKPKAEFSAEFVVSSMTYAVDADGVELEPKKLIIKTVLPQYGGKIDIMDFVATNPNVISAIEQYWSPNATFKAHGRLNFSSITETYIEEAGFGEAQKKEKTTKVSELIITGGSQEPLEGDYAFDISEINTAIAEHKAYLEQLKEKPAKNHGTKAAPAPAATVTTLDDLGF